MMISLAIHAAAFILAGMLVVFSVTQKEEKKFVPPPPVERPKMRLKKPKVQVKKSAKPKSTSRIVTKVKRTKMPDIQLPEMSGIGGQGLTGGLGGGFNIMPDLEEITMFGSSTSIGSDLKGTLYDFKRNRSGGATGVADGGSSDEDKEQIIAIVEKFIQSGWNTTSLARYYKSPKTLYTPTIMIPSTDSTLGPWAFGEREMGPWAYMLHYKGKLVHKDGIKFRFVVMADNYLVIRVNEKVVMDFKNLFAPAIDRAAFKPASYHLGHWYAFYSDWIELEPGVPQDIEFILGDFRGHIFASMVAIEEYGVDYPRTPLPQDNPKLPIFKMTKLSANQKDAIYQNMWKGHLNLDTGPIFSDYESGESTNKTKQANFDSITAKDEPLPDESKLKTQHEGIRLWTMAKGKTLEAEYMGLMGGKVMLKTVNDKIVKIPPEEFSEDDQLEIKLMNPPKLKLSFKKDTKQYALKSNPAVDTPIPVAFELAGGVKVEQEGKMPDYQRPLRLELYTIASSYDGDDDNYILFDRQIKDFTLTPENKRTFEFFGRKEVMLRYEDWTEDVRGEKYEGYMILVFNERDELIAKNLSHDWLLDIRDKLIDFPISRYFNKQGERVLPPTPKFSDRYWHMEAEDF